MSPKKLTMVFGPSRLIVAGLALILTSCQGSPSKKPPIHVNPNMDQTVSFKPQEKNAFFEDGRAMRLPVEGTVARGQANLDTQYHEGKNSDGSFVEKLPVELTRDLVLRGQDRYKVFCQPCHGGTGAGDGTVIAFGMVPPLPYHEERLRDAEDGYIYDVIANGIRNMPSYRRQIPVEDRWAIVAYVRALQHTHASRTAISQHLSEAEINTLEAEWQANKPAAPAPADTTQSNGN